MSVEFRTEWTTEGHDHLSALGPRPLRQVFGSATEAVAFGRRLLADMANPGSMVQVVRIDTSATDLHKRCLFYINAGIGLDGMPWSTEPDIAMPGEANALATTYNPWQVMDPVQR